jgi:hypothetical protein
MTNRRRVFALTSGSECRPPHIIKCGPVPRTHANRKGEHPTMAECTQLLKLECLVCESQGEACIESRFVLPRRAKKIVEIQARLVDVTGEVVDGQVLVCGVLHKQIFFVGEDCLVHHCPEDVPFSVFVDCPGATVGQEAFVDAEIARLSHELQWCQEVCQKAILQFLVKVTEDCQVNVLLDPNGPLVKAECVVGEATKGCTIENVVELCKRAKKIREIQVFLEEVCAEATQDQVMFQGTIVKNVFFITEEDVEFFQEERIPFSGIVDVPGAEPGDNVSLTAQILRVDKFLSNSRELRQRISLSVFVKVTRTAQLNVAEDLNGPLVNASQVIATNSRQILVENVAELNFPARRIHEIQARVEDLMVEVIPNKVVIQGNLHKQVFFVAEDDIIRHQGEDIPFTTFVDLPGISPDDDVVITPIVEFVGFDLVGKIGGDFSGSGSGSGTGSGREDFDASDPYSEECESPAFCRLIQRTVVQLVVRGSQEMPIRVATRPLATAM